MVLLPDAEVELLLQLLLSPLELLEEQQLLVERELVQVSQLQLWVQAELLPAEQLELSVKLAGGVLHLMGEKHIHKSFIRRKVRPPLLEL